MTDLQDALDDLHDQDVMTAVRMARAERRRRLSDRVFAVMCVMIGLAFAALMWRIWR